MNSSVLRFTEEFVLELPFYEYGTTIHFFVLHVGRDE